MFSGIIETIGKIVKLAETDTNLSITVESEIAPELKIDQSVAHNGVCLTIVALTETTYTVTAIAETLLKTNLGKLKVNDKLNLELCMKLNDRLDGHIVQGHVDTVGSIDSVTDEDGSWLYTINYPSQYALLLVEKGSICVNGVSLTAFNCGTSLFNVAIIPYTYHHTTFQYLQMGEMVNLEFDIIGKYILRQQSLK
ncbi:MAG: riboflavin synthase [Bacteroidota bacterium]|nr:riboflavin synthase [Bacteroidota bacterium]